MNPPVKNSVIPLLDWNTQLLGHDPTESNRNTTDHIKWHPELVKEYQTSLNCSSGAVCEIQKHNGLMIHAALFLWDESSSVNAIEAFRHRPEQCLGSIGMKFIQAYPDKRYRVGNETLVFAHTLFRDPKGTPVHAFKATWVAQMSSSLVNNISQIKEWRQLRTKAAMLRYKPSHARVVQGAVRAIHSPERAWEAYETAVLSALEFR